ncbi:MAG: 4-(cytidine 5'-diphospho)-2-C-methyl-D-erythritol kinase [Chitinophagaceae bacterium]|nr:4-(cytidine 5'-diphospho)-2-C-methyl-D-erythritol kinase [Chitinophagaceae bacterium]
MIAFPNCKINLGLHILNKRGDGFHNLETIFYPIPLNDALEIIPSNSLNEIAYSSSGNKVEGNEEDNLCLKAYRLLKKDFPNLSNIKLHLHKVIPSGAGLGGGSANAAFTLLLLNKKFNLNLSTAQLLNYAVQLGSDCPFFILNKPCLATGRGEVLTEINLNLSAYSFVLVNPKIHVNTGWAFSQILPTQPLKSIAAIINQPMDSWKSELVNDFEKPVVEKYPEIKGIKEQLYKQGAIYVSMSGSGSTVFGIFEKGVQFQFAFPQHYFVKWL